MSRLAEAQHVEGIGCEELLARSMLG